MSVSAPCPFCGQYGCCSGRVGGGITITPSGQLETKVPHKCPLCSGRGNFVAPFSYDNHKSTSTRTNTYFKTCHGCDGKGIVWEP